MTAFLWILVTLSLSGSVLAILVLCLTSLLRRRPTLSYYLWLLVALRLLLPFALEVNAMSRLAERLDAQEIRFTPVRMEDVPTVPEVRPDAAVIVYTPEDGEEPGAESDSAPLYVPDPAIVRGIAQTTRRLASLGAARVMLFIWLFGAGAVLLPHIWGFYRLKRLLHRSAEPPAEEQQAMLEALYSGKRRLRLFRCGAAVTPMTFGIFRPVIILPEQRFTPEELRYILLHELTHVRRFDAAYKWLMLLVTGAHWFNPLVWKIERVVSRACEYSCDAAVVRGLNVQQRIAYCRTLLQAAEAGQRQNLPAAALGEGAAAMKARMESAISFRALGRKGQAGCAVLLAFVAVLGLLLGCTDGKKAGEGAAITEPALADSSDREAIRALCTEWAEAAWTRDTAARNALLAQPDDRPMIAEVFPNVRYHPDRRMRSYTFDLGAGNAAADSREWRYAALSYVMEDNAMLQYRMTERLTLTQAGGSWRVLDQSVTYCEPSSYTELEELWGGTVFLPDFTDQDLRLMESGQLGLYGLDAGEAAVQALHLSGGELLWDGQMDGSGRAECRYHWADGDLRIVMEQPRGHSLWVPVEVEPDSLNGFSALEMRHMVLNGLPGGWETEDFLPDGAYFTCGVLDPAGERVCTLRVDRRTGEIFWLDEEGQLRPYHESPLRETLEARSTWEGEFYPYRKEEQRTVIHRIGERVFSYSRADGSSGMGRYSGNQGWTDDGKFLFVWCADGCNLEVYGRAEDGTLLLDSCESLQSDLFDIRYQERWEQNYGRGRASGLAADEAQELLESALPEGYTVEQFGVRDGWYLLGAAQDGEHLCTLAVSSRSAEFRAWDEMQNELRPYRESLLYPVIAERCAWEGSFQETGVPGMLTFFPIAEGLVGFVATGALETAYEEPSANQIFRADGGEMYLWDGDTGAVLIFQIGDGGEIVRNDGKAYQRLERVE